MALVSKFSRVSVEVFQSIAMFRSVSLSSPKQESKKTTQLDSYFGEKRGTERNIAKLQCYILLCSSSFDTQLLHVRTRPSMQIHNRMLPQYNFYISMTNVPFLAEIGIQSRGLFRFLFWRRKKDGTEHCNILNNLNGHPCFVDIFASIALGFA